MHPEGGDGYEDGMTQHPDPSVAADDNHGSDSATTPDDEHPDAVPPDVPADAPETADPAHGPVPDGSPLAGADPIGTAAAKP